MKKPLTTTDKIFAGWRMGWSAQIKHIGHVIAVCVNEDCKERIIVIAENIWCGQISEETLNKMKISGWLYAGELAELAVGERIEGKKFRMKDSGEIFTAWRNYTDYIEQDGPDMISKSEIEPYFD